tara:strand:- start:558 stop:1205 length:648 start_codon:yes stop_codon:yes gene_type:complete
MSKILNDSRLIKQSIFNQIENGINYPLLYSVIEFGFRDNYGIPLPPSQIRKYWDKTEVHKTNKLIRNMLRETFEIDKLYFFIERHASKLDQYGNQLSKGRFHLNIISSDIESHKINRETMNRKVRKLLYENGKYGIAIKDMFFKSNDELKIELFNTCCRQANWINRYNYSIKTQVLTTRKDLRNTVMYCLKDYDEQDGLCFTEVIDFESSDFIKR